MGYIPLSDEETAVIFGDEARQGLQALDATQQEQVLNRLLSIVESESPPSSFVYESIANLDIITAGDKCRLYAKVVDNIPRDNTRYHVIFVFYIDNKHDYPRRKLAQFSPRAQDKLERITDLTTVPDVDNYLEKHNALHEADLRDLLP